MLTSIFQTLRVRQWYKNLVIFLPLIFSGNLFDTDLFFLTLLGFIALSLTSTVNYIFNDIVDRKKDRKNKEKAKRPLASGKISLGFAILLLKISLIGGLLIGGMLSRSFLAFQIALLLLGTLYTILFRNEAFLDVIIISVNFVVRAVAGAVLINVEVSPWLILCPFFLALFLAVGKRKAEAELLGNKAHTHRKTLLAYTPEMSASLMNISTALLIISYSLYSFLSVQRSYLLATLPVMLYVVFRYRMLVEAGSGIARHPERLIKDTRSMIGILVWAGMVVAVMYFS